MRAAARNEKRRQRSPSLTSEEEESSFESSSPPLKTGEKRRRREVSLEDVELEPIVVLHVGQNPMQEVILSGDETKHYQFTKILGSGSTGTVYKAYPPTTRTKTTMVPVAVKVQMLVDDARGFDEEVELAELMSDIGVGAQFIESWKTDEVGFLVTEKWDMSLWDYFRRYYDYEHRDRPPCIPAKLILKLRRLIKHMHEAGFVHGDILEKNILVRVRPSAEVTHAPPELVDLTLTDFGLMQSITKWKKKPGFLETMLDYQLNPGNTTHHYLSARKIDLQKLIDNPRHLDWSLLYYFMTRCKKQSATTT
jgi:serine/threonine protein kinase